MVLFLKLFYLLTVVEMWWRVFLTKRLLTDWLGDDPGRTDAGRHSRPYRVRRWGQSTWTFRASISDNKLTQIQPVYRPTTILQSAAGRLVSKVCWGRVARSVSAASVTDRDCSRAVVKGMTYKRQSINQLELGLGALSVVCLCDMVRVL